MKTIGTWFAGVVKSQMDLFGSTPKPAAKAAGKPVKFPGMKMGNTLGGSRDPKVGDTKQEDGVEYVFQESTPGRPRWHIRMPLHNNPHKKTRAEYQRSGVDMDHEHPAVKHGDKLMANVKKVQGEIHQAAGKKMHEGALESPEVGPELRNKYAQSVAAFEKHDDDMDQSSRHRAIVVQAMGEGEDVPDDVLAEYPDLKPPAKKQPQAVVPSEPTPPGQNAPQTKKVDAEGKEMINVDAFGREHFAPLMERYKGKDIVMDGGAVSVWDPREQTLFIVALDDSKMDGPRKMVPEYNNVEGARNYIDWLEGAKKNKDEFDTLMDTWYRKTVDTPQGPGEVLTIASDIHSENPGEYEAVVKVPGKGNVTMPVSELKLAKRGKA